MIKKFTLLFLILFTVQVSHLFAAEKLDKILCNPNYSQEQKIQKLLPKADEYLKEITSIDSVENTKKKSKREIKKLEIYKEIQNNPSILMAALKTPDVSLSLVKLLVELGADCDYCVTEKINSVNYKTTVLHCACLTENPDIISYLIPLCSKNLESKMPEMNKNGIVNSKNALALLCQEQVKYYKADSGTNFYDCIELLLQKKPGLINSEYFDNGRKGTVLHMAAMNNEKQLYKLLRKYGGNNQLKDNQGVSALQYLQKFCENDVDFLDLLYEEFSVNEKQAEKKALLEKIAASDIDQLTSSDQKSALVLSINNKDYEAAEFLLAAGADFQLSDSLGKDAVQYAIEDKVSYHIIQLLVNKYLELPGNAKAAGKITLLMQFVKLGDADLLKQILPVLLHNNHDILEQKDINGWTPFLYAAVYNSDPKVLKILRMYGADVFVQDVYKRNAVILAKEFNSNQEAIIAALNKYGVY